MKDTYPIYTYDENELIAKNTTKKNLYIAILFSAIGLYLLAGPYEKTRVLFSWNIVFSIILVVWLASGFVFFLYRYLDKRIKLVINKKGIWTKKNGLATWEQVWYFFIKIGGDKTKIENLVLKLKESETKIFINLNEYDKGKEEILTSFRHYAAQYPINDLGFD